MGPPTWVGGEALGAAEEHLVDWVLQWGRRPGSAERKDRATVIEPWPCASMGPPTWVGGEPRSSTRNEVSFPLLQWGRRPGSAESRARRGYAVAGLAAASMGPPTWVGGESLARDLRVPTRPASMGPPTWVGGESNVRASVGRRSCASMGPPTWVGGELPSWQRERDASWALQWGRRPGSAESSRSAT